jgi:archaellum component FlaD/FlaE
MDQSAINKIIVDSTATEDSNKRVEKLEKEVMILKGSIKKLIVDIREQMNNAENPFLNIQQLQMPAQAPVIKEDPIELDVPDNPDLDDEEPGAKKSKPKNKGRKTPKEGGLEEDGEELGDEAAEDRADRSARARDTGDRAKPDLAKGDLTKRDLEMINEFEEQKKMLEAMKSRTSAAGPASLTGSKRIDPYTMNQIMDWTRMMLRKNGSDRMKDLLEMYVSTGYISEETKAIVQRMSKLMESEPTRPPKRLDIKECVSDLYTLYVILNPGDKDLDSKMLTVLLNPEDRY